ncbi:hypothetical protein UFOVP657_42 [uncultured Caudovirales phage]|uniref:Uncharacterized protein n=1 Tax=uncultured Caudovirales phage TaxID=2100421 RepID=A0A6J5NBF3_9CAUD|nr:hypothetical protein UFOVP467_69 [uncultured Caudovirales phage]CAB4156193.1 hypothetical protein UFOVP657_42 [uncultured Caudovirales phage]
MNPMALMAYLDAQNKSKQKQNEQQNTFAQQMMQQQLGMAQTGMELRDKAVARTQQQESFKTSQEAAAAAARLNALQVAAAERAAKLAPVEEKKGFYAPLVQPYAAYTSALDSYKAYIDPKNTKVKLPSKERALLDAIRTSRSNLVGAREGLGRLAESSGMEGITLADMDKNYPVLPLPIFGAAQTLPGEAGVRKSEVAPRLDPTAAPAPGSFPTASAPASASILDTGLPAAQQVAMGRPTLGMPPSAFAPAQQPFPSSLAGFMMSPGAIGVNPSMMGAVKPPVKPAAQAVAPVAVKPQAPPAPLIPKYGESLQAFTKRVDAIRAAENNISWSDLDEPEQTKVDSVVGSMVKEVMDTFVPQTWDAKATGREHAQRSADDFFAHGTSEAMVKRLLAKYAVGDSSVMKSVILDRFVNAFSEFNLPPALQERLVKQAKDVLDVKETEDKLTTAAANRVYARNADARAGRTEARSQGMHNVEKAGKELALRQANETYRADIKRINAQAEEAVTNSKIASQQLAKMERDVTEGKKVNYLSVWGSAEKLLNQVVNDPINKVVDSLSENVKLRLQSALSSNQDGSARSLRDQLDLLSTVKARLLAPPKNYISSINNNSPGAYALLEQHKADILKDVKMNPNLAPFFREILNTTGGGAMPGANK